MRCVHSMCSPATRHREGIPGVLQMCLVVVAGVWFSNCCAFACHFLSNCVEMCACVYVRHTLMLELGMFSFSFLLQSVCARCVNPFPLGCPPACKLDLRRSIGLRRRNRVERFMRSRCRGVLHCTWAWPPHPFGRRVKAEPCNPRTPCFSVSFFWTPRAAS